MKDDYKGRCHLGMEAEATFVLWAMKGLALTGMAKGKHRGG